MLSMLMPNPSAGVMHSGRPELIPTTQASQSAGQSGVDRDIQHVYRGFKVTNHG